MWELSYPEMVQPVSEYVVPVPKVELLKRLSVVTVSLFVDSDRLRINNVNVNIANFLI